MLSKKKVDYIFGNIDAIFLTNKEFLGILQEKESEGIVENVGDAFLKIVWTIVEHSFPYWWFIKHIVNATLPR